MSGSVHDLALPTERGPADRTRMRLSRRDFLAGAAAFVTGMTIDAGLIARHDVEVHQQTIHIARLPPAFHGFRIAQISDIHMEEFTESFFLRLVLERVNSLAADVVLLTGDFASRGPFPRSISVRAAARCGEMLGKYLAAPERYAVLGNHDNIIGAPIVLDALAHARIPVLVNRYLPIERGADHLWLAGVDDPGTGRANLDFAVPEAADAPVILMAHSPDFTDAVISHPFGHLVDLVLSGHTHGGQVRLPFLGPMVLPPGGRKYIHGLFHFDKLQLYVNRGIGTVGMPIRFDCRPEITLFTLQPQV